MNLLESYKNRLALSEQLYQRNNNGSRMSAAKKLMIAQVLDNTSKFMNEALATSAATQRSAMGDFKKFCLNIATVSLPNLILPEIMLVQPMTSYTGYISYWRYVAGVNKGGVTTKTVLNGVYKLGKADEARADYTSDRVVETLTAQDTTFNPTWGPIVPDVFKVTVSGVTTEYDAKITSVATVKNADGEVVRTVSLEPAYVNEGGSLSGVPTISADDLEEGETVSYVRKVAYVYDNIDIPQVGNTKTDTTYGAPIPTLKAQMVGIALQAHARRIGIYYSQIAAFQAKTDYGTDLAEQLSAQAQGELAYEIDTEGVLMLAEGAEFDKNLSLDSYEVAQNINNNGIYVSPSQYYEKLTEIVARAKQIIYDRTQKFAPNYMLVGSRVMTVLPYAKGWTPSNVTSFAGPYFAGTLDGMKVFVSPALPGNKIIFGVNGSDLQTSAAVYAPYMAIVPTQVLGMPDGGISQGFATMYDMKLLSTYNIVEEGGKVVDRVDAGYADEAMGTNAEIGKYSHLLVAGNIVFKD